MNTQDLIKLVQDIVRDATALKDELTDEKFAPVNYAAIFSQNEASYEELLLVSGKLGKVIEHTPTGDLFEVEPIDTVSGKLRLLKVRNPDMTRKENGDADFTVENYADFKDACSANPGFNLIERDAYEMIELTKPGSKVRAYFSNPPLDKELGI